MSTDGGGIIIKDYGQQVAPEKSQARLELEAQHGQVWDTKEMAADFQALFFSAPYMTVVRKSDGKRGTLEFTHNPRLYFNFEED